MGFRLLLLGTVFLISAWGVSAPVPGDVNGSGIVEMADADLLIDHLLDVDALNATEEARADCNGQPGLDAHEIGRCEVTTSTGSPSPAYASRGVRDFLTTD